MSSNLATLAYALGIAGLFLLARDRSAQTSRALWVPVAWWLIVASRNVGEWLALGAPLEPTSDRYLEGSPVDRFILSVLLLLGLSVLVARGKRTVHMLSANAPIILYFTYCAISMLWSDYPTVGIKRWFRSVGDLVMVLVILTEPDRIASLKRVLTRVGFFVIPVSILFIKYYPELGRAGGRWDGRVSWTGVAGGKNGLGMICLVFGSACLWSLFASLREKVRQVRLRKSVAYGTVLAMAGWLLWLADSKTSLALFAIASTIMILLNVIPFLRRPVFVHLMVVMAVAVPLAVLFLGFGSSALESMGRDSTLTGRTEIWKIVVQFVKNPILGAGYETFWLGERFMELGRMTRLAGVEAVNQAHNGYIEVYLNLGWIGLSLLAGLMATGYSRIIVDLRTAPEFGALKLAFFIVAIVYNFTEGAFKMMTSVWIAFLVATAAVPQMRSVAARRPRFRLGAAASGAEPAGFGDAVTVPGELRKR